MICNICKRNMKIFSKNSKNIFYKCPYCHFYDTYVVEGSHDFDYDNYETFDNELSEFDSMVKDAMNILEYKFKLIGVKPDSFIDIGCSEGVFVKAFQRLSGGKKASGIEVSAPKIERAKRRGLDVANYDNAFGEYDFVLLRHVIEHIEKSSDYIDYISKRFLSKNGVLCIETPNNDHLGAIKRGNRIDNERYCRELYPPTHICGYTAKTFRTFAHLHNYKIIKMTTYSYEDEWCYPSTGYSGSFRERIKNKAFLGLNLAVFLQKK